MPKMTKMLLPLALLLAAGLALSGCGRKGDLDPPSVAAKNADKYGRKNQAAPPVEDKHFLLDPLL